MALSLGVNIAVLRARRNLALLSNRIGICLERLSSGSRINRPSDDPAGFSIAMTLRAQARLARVAVRNVNDGISALHIADGAMETISSLLTRMGELAAQAANGTYSNQQRAALQLEFSQLGSEIDRVAAGTSFNGLALLNKDAQLSVQAGIGSSESTLSLFTVNGTLQGLGLGAEGLTYSLVGQNAADSISASRQALEKVKEALGTVSLKRATLGANDSRLSASVGNLENLHENLCAAESRIMDTDVAAEAAELTRLLILQQVTAAVIAQANQSSRLALMLITSAS